MKQKTRILLVDDHAVVRMGLAAIIGVAKDMTVCGEAENGDDAIELAGRLKPDIVMMDLMMPGKSGAETTGEVLKASPTSKVLILTTFGTAAEIADALEAGATGAITKNLPSEDLRSAIRDTVAGIRRLSPEIEESLVETGGKTRLTPRQHEVLDSIMHGLSNDNIAALLGISKARVKQHLNEVYEKLGAANRAEAISIAMRRHLHKF